MGVSLNAWVKKSNSCQPNSCLPLVTLLYYFSLDQNVMDLWLRQMQQMFQLEL